MRGPENTLPMMSGKGPFGNIEMGGMFTLIKVREGLARDDYRDPGWFAHPKGTVAQRVSADPEFGRPIRRGKTVSRTPDRARDPHEGHHR
jgi:hypothetical protein